MPPKSKKTNRTTTVATSATLPEQNKNATVDDGIDNDDGNNQNVNVNHDDNDNDGDNDKQHDDGNEGNNNNGDKNNNAKAITTNQKLASKANTSSPSSKQNKGSVSLYHVIVIFNTNNYS